MLQTRRQFCHLFVREIALQKFKRKYYLRDRLKKEIEKVIGLVEEEEEETEVLIF